MNYLTYAPSVDVYIAATRNGTTKYYDVSQDISSCKVTRRVNDASSFSLTLSNKNRKYNGLFMAMDRITIYATKTEKTRLLTGYITEVDAFSLYAKDINISGKCSLYQLQQTYWDNLLLASQQMVKTNYTDPFGDGGLWKAAYNMIVQVGHWSEDSVLIASDIPQSVIDWAASVYATQKGDIEQSESVMKSFERALKEHGPSLGAASTSGSIIDSESGGIRLSGDESKASDAQKKLVQVAQSGSVPGEGGMCLKWVGDVYEVAGYPFQRYWGAIEVWRNRQSHKSYGSNKTGIPLGACVVTTGSGSNGAGHIGIYIGGGKVISEVGGQRVETVDGFGSWANDYIDGRAGWCGWVGPSCSIDWK